MSIYPTRARKRRLTLLFTVIATMVLLVLGGLGASAWGVMTLLGVSLGSDEDTATAATGAAADAGGLAAPNDSLDADLLAGLAIGADYQIGSLVDLVAFRDAAYVPVKGVHVTSNKTTDKASMGRIMDIIDLTEFNAMVVAVKDDVGRVAFNSEAPMALENGTVDPIIWG